jgi:outer membrane biosynthesis protein TonB
VSVRTTQISLAALVLISTTFAIGIDARQTSNPLPQSKEVQTAWRDRFCPSTGEPTATDVFEPDLHRVSDKGVTPPKPTRQMFARYTADAMSRKVQGCVVLQAVVEVDGKVRRYRVSRSLEESLHRASTEALKEWEFVINSSVPLCLVPSLVAR